MTDDAAAEAGQPRPTPKRLTAAEVRARAIADHKAGRLDDAFKAYRLYLRVKPQDAGIWTNLGALLRKRGEHDAASVCQGRAHALAPEDTSILGNLGNALQDADRLEEALDIRREVRRRKPEDAEAHAMMAVTLRSLGRMEEAADVASDGLSKHRDHMELRVQRAMARLALGDYARGFEDFAARWHIGEIDKPAYPEPEWQGEDLSAKRLLVLPEQGNGDTLLMLRFLPQLKARGAHVILVTKPPLARLVANAPGADVVLPTGAPKPQVDLVTHMMDLPRWLGARPAELPRSPALEPPEDSLRRARAIAAPFDNRFRIGVVWSGSITYKANFKRSFDASRFLPLADLPDVQLFSLYKGPLLDKFREGGESGLIVDAAGDDRDFADAAALVREMDLVIGVDTGVMHLAAVMGRPVWNLLAYSPYWLYGTSGDATPWHPTMRLFRQTAPGDWDGVMEQVQAALKAQLASWRESRA